ncbi:Uncharacterised protein [Mycobacteroides abscessus subsp. abscessus]|nr:hypothetical protein [Mycobacteroides abscessus]MDO3312595.1 hypothetical protein [Mycobacteroides abscessus subsp. abscessus]MDO3344723.1 hypothetical protein [Mycobacteroides abscessus subsp. abscessus]SHP02458.1 Uncharacterised protein [Mycobacteroides abscessus subsp. abscessus]SHP17923.1 Uncharacterised protein [Mycobacteroides abscessus subsp. abscessus]SHP89043.1 Uncharacterised protein [Mycobacteroides abscessus subsp. abscessus]
MTDEVIVTDDAGNTATPPSAGQNQQGHADKLLQEKGFRAAFEHESRVREEVDRIQQQEGIGPYAGTTDTGTPKPTAPPLAAAPEATVTDAAEAAKSTPRVGTIANTIGAGVSKDLYKSPVDGVKGLFKAQYGAGSDLTGKALNKLGVKTSAKVLARAIPGIGSIYAAYESYKSFEDGNYIAGVLNLVGVIPGPVGWIGMGAAAAWDMVAPHQTYGMWDAPDGTNTSMLPASAKDVAGVKELDATLRQAQQSVFSFQDGPAGTVWNENHPSPLVLNSQAVSTAFTSWLGGVSDLFAQVDQTMASSGEPYFQQYRQELTPHLQAMAKLKEQIKPITDQLAAASAGGQKCYQGVLDINKAARQQLANDGALTDQGAISGPQAAIHGGVSAIRDANDKLGKVFDAAPPAVITSKSPTAAPTSTAEKGRTEKTPVTTAANSTPLTSPDKKLESKGDDLGKLLSGLGNKGFGGSPGGTPLGGNPLGGGHGAGTPLTSQTPKATTEPKKLLDDKKEDTKKREEKTLPKAQPINNAVTPPPAAPTTPVPGNPAPGVPKPAAGAPDTTVDVKGKKIKFPDAKTAKLAKLLAAADPNHPISLADAAAQSGLTPPVPGQDPGKQIPPADAKPGDFLVAGDKHFMVLGDGKFYDLAQYRTIDASELPHDMGSRAGYFRLGDPGAAAAGQGPVSGPTSGVPFSVPGATDAPTAPADTSAGAPAAQPAAPHPMGAAQQSVQSTGSPGVPKPGGTAPANAAATNTGAGTSVPSSTVHNLDPSAVK